MLMSGLETREDRLPFSIGSRAHIVASAVLGSPVTFVERGVGRAFGRTGAFLNFYTMKMVGVVTGVLAQSTALVRTIYVVRKELAVPGHLAYRLAGLRGQRAIGKARRAAAAALVRHSRAASGELLVEVDVVIARSRFFGIVFWRKVSTKFGQLINGETRTTRATRRLRSRRHCLTFSDRRY